MGDDKDLIDEEDISEQRAFVDGHPANEAPVKALALLKRYAGFDGSHHKDWLIDQVVRVLSGENYDKWIVNYNDREDGPETYSWSEGIPP